MTQHQAPEVTSELRECPNPWCDSQMAPFVHLYPMDAAVTCSCGFMGPLRATTDDAITAWNTRATQPLSLTVETGDSQQTAAFDVLDWLRDNREAIIDRLQSLSGSNCFQNGNGSPVGDGVMKAAADLVAKLDECDPHLTSMFSFALAHDHLYSGPQYGEALEALRAALGEQIAENANCSGDIDRSGLAQEVG